jgi:hypothetical protein
MENLNANEYSTYKYWINICMLILLKGNKFFVTEFAYYNIAHSKIRRSKFIHNKGPAMSYKALSVARKTRDLKCEKF